MSTCGSCPSLPAEDELSKSAEHRAAGGAQFSTTRGLSRAVLAKSVHAWRWGQLRSGMTAMLSASLVRPPVATAAIGSSQWVGRRPMPRSGYARSVPLCFGPRCSGLAPSARYVPVHQEDQEIAARCAAAQRPASGRSLSALPRPHQSRCVGQPEPLEPREAQMVVSRPRRAAVERALDDQTRSSPKARPPQP